MDVVYNFTWTYATTGGETRFFTYDWTSSVTFKDGTTTYMPEDENDEPTVFFMYYPDYDQKRYTLSGQAVGSRMSRYDIGTPTEVPGFDSSYYDLDNKVNNVDYNSNSKGYKGSDLIVINNLGNIPTKFFIVKQRTEKLFEGIKAQVDIFKISIYRIKFHNYTLLYIYYLANGLIDCWQIFLWFVSSPTCCLLIL